MNFIMNKKMMQISQIRRYIMCKDMFFSYCLELQLFCEAVTLNIELNNMLLLLSIYGNKEFQ